MFFDIEICAAQNEIGQRMGNKYTELVGTAVLWFAYNAFRFL